MILLSFALLTAPLSPPSTITVSAYMSAASAFRGTWDIGPFDNDTASDWYLEFSENPSWESVRKAFAATARSRRVDADTASVAIAAAAIVAAVHQQRFDTLPTEGRATISILEAPSPDLLRAANTALSRIEQNSELAELWNEDDPAAWVTSLNLIRTGLK